MKNQNNKNSFNQKPHFNFKSLIILILLAVGMYLFIPKLVGVEEALRLILKVNKFYLIAALFSEIISYGGAAVLLGIILSRLGYQISFLNRFKLGSIAAFAIHFFPIGSFGEGAIEYYFLRKFKVETGSILLMLVLRIILSYSAFLVLFLIGLILVPTAPALHFSPKIVSLILFLLIFSGVLYMIYLYEHKEKFKQRWGKFVNCVNFFLVKLLRQNPIKNAKSQEIFEDIYKGIGLFGEKKRTSLFAILAAFSYWFFDMLCLFFVFLSFGCPIHFGILIFGYGVATLAGLISFIPGGVGVIEGSLGLIYTSLGIPASSVLMSILVFRFFSFWIWIPLGLISYLSLKKEINANA